MTKYAQTYTFSSVYLIAFIFLYLLPSNYERIYDAFWRFMQYDKTIVGSVALVLYGIFSNILFDVTIRPSFTKTNCLSSYSCGYRGSSATRCDESYCDGAPKTD